MLTTTKKKSGFASRGKRGRSAINLTENAMIDVAPMFPGKSLPLLVRPNVRGLELGEWVSNNFDELNKMLYSAGAVVFRGFDLQTDEDFAAFMDSLPQDRLPYFEGSTPRKEISEKVYTSTLHPPDQTIALHSEYSSSTKFPMKVWFFCTQEPDTGGETPIADARKILQRIDPEVRARFEKHGWMLIRNYGDGLGLPWKRAFAIDNREDLEAYTASVQIEVRWKDEDRLWTRQVRRAIERHPETDEPAWFNHMAFWHPANLDPDVRAHMLETVGEEGLPYNTFYGDGERIPDEVARAIHDAYLAEKIKFQWKRGDLMVIDNILTTHGRETFTGERQIRVAMTEPYFRPDFATARD